MRGKGVCTPLNTICSCTPSDSSTLPPDNNPQSTHVLLLNNLFDFVFRPQVQHTWQLLVVKSSIRTTERAGVMDQMSGRRHEVANTSGIVSAVSLKQSCNIYINH